MISSNYFTDLGHTAEWHRMNLSKDPPTLAEIFADRITSKHNKDVLFLLVGERGAGKSYCLLSLAIGIAKCVAKKDKEKKKTWHDYFSMNNIAVIQEEDLVERMENLEQHNVYILDDAGVGWDSRDFASRTNKKLNHILQVCRTANTCLLISVPDPILIDKVPRTQVKYYGEIAEQLHEFGMSLVKVFQNKRLFREGKTLQTYMRFGRGVVRRFVVEPPPYDVAIEYDKVRKEMAEKVGQQIDKKTPTPKDDETHPEFEGHITTIFHIIKDKRMKILNAISQYNSEHGTNITYQQYITHKTKMGLH